MKIFYINLENRCDRKGHMEEMLSKLGVDYERFNAISPSLEQIKTGVYQKFFMKGSHFLKQLTKKDRCQKRARGVFGCYLSHLFIHEKMTESRSPYLILEDDVIISSNSIDELKKMTENESFKDWDIIRSIWNNKEGYLSESGFKNINRDIKKITGVPKQSKFKTDFETHLIFGGTHFSLFRNSKKIQSFLREESVFDIDAVYSNVKLNVYCDRTPMHKTQPKGILDVSLVDWRGSDIPKTLL